MKKISLIPLFLVLVLSCKGSSQIAKDNQKEISKIKDSLTAKLESANKEGEIVGFSVSILKQNEVLYNRGFGLADSKNNLDYKTNTIQNIGSVAKTLLGISLLKAQELGKLDLDDPINQYLPFEVVNPNFPDIPITIRQLATHTSSIVDEEENYLKAFVLEKDEVNQEEETAFTHFQKSDKRISLSEFLQACLSKEGKWYKPEMFSEKNLEKTLSIQTLAPIYVV
ncbi:MAG: serine hydrolase domain-containing protein [Maribacter sp.]